MGWKRTMHMDFFISMLVVGSLLPAVVIYLLLAIEDLETVEVFLALFVTASFLFVVLFLTRSVRRGLHVMDHRVKRRARLPLDVVRDQMETVLGGTGYEPRTRTRRTWTGRTRVDLEFTFHGGDAAIMLWADGDGTWLCVRSDMPDREDLLRDIDRAMGAAWS